MHRKPNNLSKAGRQADKIHKQASKVPPVDPNVFEKKTVSRNITIYLGKEKNYIHYKDNPMGFGGNAIKIKLSDGTTESVVGPFFAKREWLEKFMNY